MEYEILRRKTKQHQKTTQKKPKIKKQKKKTTANAYYPQEL